VTTPEDEIRQTFGLYAKYVDDRDSEGYASTFVEDGRIRSSRGLFVGRAELKKSLEDLYTARPPDRQFKHVWSNELITIEGDSADLVSDLLVFECFEGRPWVMSIVARHRDKLAKQPDGRWLFTEKLGQGGLFGFGTYAPKDYPQPTFGIRPNAETNPSKE
jgi:SnoaL-like domain